MLFLRFGDLFEAHSRDFGHELDAVDRFALEGFEVPKITFRRDEPAQRVAVFVAQKGVVTDAGEGLVKEDRVEPGLTEFFDVMFYAWMRTPHGRKRLCCLVGT